MHALVTPSRRGAAQRNVRRHAVHISTARPRPQTQVAQPLAPCVTPPLFTPFLLLRLLLHASSPSLQYGVLGEVLSEKLEEVVRQLAEQRGTYAALEARYNRVMHQYAAAVGGWRRRRAGAAAGTAGRNGGNYGGRRWCGRLGVGYG